MANQESKTNGQKEKTEGGEMSGDLIKSESLAYTQLLQPVESN